jgi:NAD(P)-dependent dehydrogenase (short-subunit alcohol dehydrogenase family)
VNGIAPGLGETGLVVNAPREFLDANARNSILGRLCTPEDVAPVAAFLASDICSYMAGNSSGSIFRKMQVIACQIYSRPE